MPELLTLDDLDLGTLAGRRIFVRVDFNVPLSPQGEVLDATRLEEALPTLRELIVLRAYRMLYQVVEPRNEVIVVAFIHGARLLENALDEMF